MITEPPYELVELRRPGRFTPCPILHLADLDKSRTPWKGPTLCGLEVGRRYFTIKAKRTLRRGAWKLHLSGGAVESKHTGFPTGTYRVCRSCLKSYVPGLDTGTVRVQR